MLVELCELLKGICYKLFRMGVQCVAIHSDIDKYSKFVQMSDQAFRVGPNPSSTSLLINSLKLS